MESKKGMFNLSNATKDRITLILPLLWIGMIMFVFLDLGYMGMFLAIIHGMISATLGLSEGEYINKKLFLVFVIGWGILMFVALTGMIYYAVKFGNEVPDFSILGMHPSAFYFYIICWLGNLIYLGGFLVIFKDIWLPEEKWNSFVEYAASVNNPIISTETNDSPNNDQEEIMEGLHE